MENQPGQSTPELAPSLINQSQLPPQKSFKANSLMIGGLILGAVVISSLVGIFLGRTLLAPKPSTPTVVVPTFVLNQSPTALPTAIPTQTAAPDQTAGWKTYKNDKLSFSLKYPESLRLAEAQQCLYLLELTSKSSKQMEYCENPEIAPISLYFSTSSSFNGFNVGDGSAFSEDRSQITVDGVAAIKQIIQKTSAAPGPEYAQYITFSKENTHFQFSVTDKKYQALFDQILSTFQFLN